MSGPTNAPPIARSGNIARRPADYALDSTSEDVAANASGAIKQKICRATASNTEATRLLKTAVHRLGTEILESSALLEMIRSTGDARQVGQVPERGIQCATLHAGNSPATLIMGKRFLVHRRGWLAFTA